MTGDRLKRRRGSPAKRRAARGRRPDFTETRLSTKTVYRGRLLHVREDAVRLPDGGTSRREYIRHPGAAAMVPLLAGDRVVLARQYRYAAGRHFYEIPAGKREHGESALATARRELREECGYTASSWRRLGAIHPCIGYSDERIEIYLARGLRHAGRLHEDGEFIEVVEIGFDRALAWIADGRITDPKTIVGLLWADPYRRRSIKAEVSSRKAEVRRRWRRVRRSTPRRRAPARSGG